MAALDEVPGLEVHAAVNNVPLYEYKEHASRSPKNTVKRYVEAHTNARFEIYFTFARPFPEDRAVSMLVTIDGKKVNEHIVQASELFDVDGSASNGPVSKSGPIWNLRRYHFRGIRIKTGQGGAVSEELKAALAPVGLISCDFYFLDNPKRDNATQSPCQSMEGLPAIDEKALKGVR